MGVLRTPSKYWAPPPLSSPVEGEDLYGKRRVGIDPCCSGIQPIADFVIGNLATLPHHKIPINNIAAGFLILPTEARRGERLLLLLGGEAIFF